MKPYFLTRDKEKTENLYKLLEYSDGPKFEFTFNEFSSDGMISDSEIKSEVQNWAFPNKFSRKVEPQEVIYEAMKAIIEQNDVLSSPDRLYQLCL